MGIAMGISTGIGIVAEREMGRLKIVGCRISKSVSSVRINFSLWMARPEFILEKDVSEAIDSMDMQEAVELCFDESMVVIVVMVLAAESARERVVDCGEAGDLGSKERRGLWEWRVE